MKPSLAIAISGLSIVAIYIGYIATDKNHTVLPEDISVRTINPEAAHQHTETLRVPHLFGLGPNMYDFQIVSYHITKRFGQPYIVGTIKNNGKYAAGVELSASILDEAGNLVGTTKFWPNGTRNILPGKSAPIAYPVFVGQFYNNIDLSVDAIKAWEHN